jgi:hypothetical protein
MDPEMLFGQALETTPPWQVRRSAFPPETTRWDLFLGFPNRAVMLSAPL